jgi:hypothetical protein
VVEVVEEDIFQVMCLIEVAEEMVVVAMQVQAVLVDVENTHQ